MLFIPFYMSNDASITSRTTDARLKIFLHSVSSETQILLILSLLFGEKKSKSQKKAEDSRQFSFTKIT